MAIKTQTVLFLLLYWRNFEKCIATHTRKAFLKSFGQTFFPTFFLKVLNQCINSDINYLIGNL